MCPMLRASWGPLVSPPICGSADIMINAGLVVWLKSWVGFVAGVYAA